MSSLEAFLNSKAQLSPVSQREIARICCLPVPEKLTLEEKERFHKQNSNVMAYQKGFRFLEPQMEAIAQYNKYKKGFFPIGVGWGKTLICEIIASLAYEDGIDKIMLLIPPNVYTQFMRRDIPWARNKVPITVPFHGLGAKSKRQRYAIANSGRRGCYVVPYSVLSREDARSIVEAIEPKLVICDEAHYLKNPKAARTKRLLAFIKDRSVAGVCLSGTITDKSIRNYHHLIRWCLGEHCPLPHSPITAGEWSLIIDADAAPSASQTGPIMPLVHWARANFPNEEIPLGISGFRHAYRLRLTNCPGVTVTGDQEIGTSLTFHNIPSPYEMGQECKELIRQVEDDYITPNGDPIDHAIHTWRHLYALNHGFWHKLYWPAPEVFARNHKCAIVEAERRIQEGKDHHEAHNEYTKALRSWLSNTNRAGLDTPMLVGQYMEQHKGKGLPYELYHLWKTAKELEIDGMAVRYKEPIYVDDFKVKAAVDWAKDHPRKAIIWYYYDGLGRWLISELQKAGIDAHWCPAGREHNDYIMNPAAAGRVVVASMSAHGTGKNLQHFQHVYYAQWPRSAIMAEQSIGRVHRKGQEADEILADQCLTTQWDRLNLAACLNDALYISQSTGQRQKVIYGNYDPLPEVYPSEFLRERGFQNKRLSLQQQQDLMDRFRNG